MKDMADSGTKLVFSIFYDMPWSTAVEDPPTETAVAATAWELLVGGAEVFAFEKKATAEAQAAVIPLPAAGRMMLAGLDARGLARRRSAA